MSSVFQIEACVLLERITAPIYPPEVVAFTIAAGTLVKFGSLTASAVR
jgi:hypothetical protein